jgi:predicted nucleotidyltransferase component of viral defense system
LERELIGRDEIDLAATNLEVRPTDIERDYLLGWLLSAIFQGPLATNLVLKGGNALRKGYFPNTRYSPDLDFATQDQLSQDILRSELTRATRFVHEQTSVEFDMDHIRVEPKTRIIKELQVVEARIYFRDFYGKTGSMVVSIRMDFTQFERLLFDPVERTLIHPYSDVARCAASIRCVRLEEILASKLKCLLQRRHVADLYDYVHWLFFEQEQVDVSAVLSAFLQKTIYGRDPGAAFELLVGLPFQFLREAWGKFVVAPPRSLVAFEDALVKFVDHLRHLFGSHAADEHQRRWRPTIFFPSRLRNVILEAGSRQTLIRMVYDGYERLVEPYSLRYKRLKEGGAYEYFYAYDRTGGRSGGPGIKSFVPEKFVSAQVTDMPFKPRFEIEVSKAGDPSQAGAFSGRRYVPAFGLTRRNARSGPLYVFRCTRCQRLFGHRSFDGSLRPHKNSRGPRCYGTFGTYVKTRW